MKVAIHHHPNSFSEKWIEYCVNNKIEYSLVNCYENDIIKQLNCYNILLWHWSQADSKAILFARQLTFSIEEMGLTVFPNSRTIWHFDDKVGQKYLLEAIGARIVPSYVFYNKREAINWVKKADFPKVFKLRGGAGSVNVSLVRTKRSAYKLIRKAFGLGFKVTNSKNSFNDRIRKFKKEITIKSAIHLVKGIIRIFVPPFDDRMRPREKGYVYFQEFIPHNDYDIRIIVIGKRAFAIKRYVRKNDFRASGSGNVEYSQKSIPIECVKLAFELNDKLNNQCIAFDFVKNENDYFVIEISYGFIPKVYLKCPGYWDNLLNWHEGYFSPEYFMIEDLLKEQSEKNKF